ncbi:hypothetical protein ACH4PU_14230 [Streptomyces sp. NPDC021100]|uniref:hypothetical protein n=1 Tax=Streptomyces sp. NPDC021100 TaxID=3365114 RepID=UPI0037A94363
MIYLALAGFLVLGLVSLLAAVTGYRGRACDRHQGYEVPRAVLEDRELSAKANGLIAFWCTGAAVLSVPPLVPLAGMLLREEDPSLPVGALLALAGYGFVVVVVCRYPFERIRRMG